MVRRKISRKTPLSLKLAVWVLFLGIMISLIFAFRLYKAVFLPSVKVEAAEGQLFFIPEGADYEWLVNELDEMGFIDDIRAFNWLAKKKNLSSHVNPGRYRIKAQMNNNELVNMIRSGDQEPVILLFNNLRTLNDLAGIAARYLEPDSSEFAVFLNDPEVAEKAGFNKESFPAMFIPDSYEFYWNTSCEEFVKRMKREYISFWEGSREKKRKETGLSRTQVSILASIVEQESLFNSENERIAGVYINRLKKGIPLQSDPTIIYAHGDYSIRRVLNAHKKINSSYNTYKHRGLPPGPICLPSVSAIDGVLNFETHRYYYFCAKPDFSGYHNFATSLSQHNKNARLYQHALNEKKIYR